MKCTSCGTELSEDAKFCSYCGQKIEIDSAPGVEESGIPTVSHGEKIKTENIIDTKSDAPKSLTAKAKNKVTEIWNKLSIFGKVATVSITVFVLLCLVALLAKKTFAVVISNIQIIIAAISILMHKGVIKVDQKKKWRKWLVLVVAILFSVLNVMSYSWGSRISTNDKTPLISNENSENETKGISDTSNDFTPSSVNKTAIVPYGASECLGVNHESLVAEYKKAGFQNVSVEAIADLELGDLDQKGQVYEITIDGTAVFESGDAFDKNVTVKVIYHDAKNIKVPISSEDATGTDIEELINLFEGAGFANLATETVEDIDPEYSRDAFRNHVSIENDDSFTISDSFPIDAEIKIVTHIPYEKYKVTLHINFIPNLFFNKYGVDVSRGYTELGTLSHGEDGDFEMWLKPGKYTFTFTKVSYIKPTKDITIEVKGESEIFYDLSCYEDSIHMEKTAHIDMGAIGEDEAAVPASASDYKYDNYKEVEIDLKSAGFTNITTEILYDIVWGWTDEGEVKSVSIDGRTNYNKGEVFKKDALIVITYHMPEEDDPNKSVETEPEETESTVLKPEETESTTEPDTPKSEYEKAYIRDLNNYDLYYMFDTDTKTVVYFGTNDSYVDKGTYTGDFSNGVKITWDHGEWTEKFIHKSGSYATLIDGNGFDWEFKVCDVEKAQRILNDLQYVLSFR